MATVLIDLNTRCWSGDAAAATVKKAIKGKREKASIFYGVPFQNG